MINDYLAYISACTKLTEYNDSYYSKGISLIPDEEYDRLRKDVIHWETKNPDKVLDISPTFKVGNPVKQENKKEELHHEYRMLSLENALDHDEAESWINLWVSKYGKEVPIIGEFKYDGMALSLRYVDGVFTRALTRGDGEYGEDVTIHAATFVQERIEATGTVEIRGEAFIRRSVLDAMNVGEEKYVNCRNAVAGLLNRKVPNQFSSDITFTPYDIEGPDFIFNSYGDKLEVLKQLGFQSLSCFILSSPFAIHKVVEKVHELRLNGDIPFDIDGMVFKIDDTTKQIELGETNHSPKWAFAYKFPPVTGKARLLDVVFQVGRTGEVAPVAKISATPLLGVVVTSVSLHNEERMRERRIAIGNTYEVWRSGDVIPHMGKMVEEIENAEYVSFPKHCPSCGSVLVKRGAIYYCNNSTQCRAQLKAGITYAVSRDVLNVDGLAEQTIDLLLSAGLIARTADIFNLSVDDISQLEGYTKYSATKLEKSIWRARETTFDRFIMALGIMDVGKSTARKLSQKLFNRETLFDLDTAEKVLALGVGDVGPSTAANIAEYFSDPQKRQDAIDLFKQTFIPDIGKSQSIEGIKGKTFVFTGSFSDSREAYESKVLSAGGSVSSNISQKTDFCVVGDNPGSKFRKANLIGVETIDERVFLSLFVPREV